MFKLDDNLLRELGLGALPAEEKNRMLAHIYETLELRVGMKLAEQMSNDQLDEFEGFIDRNDEAGALKWLETNFPNYKQVVADELEALKGEIKASSAQILAASQAAAQQMPQGQPPATSAYPQPQVQPGQPMPAAPDNVVQFPQQPQQPPMPQYPPQNFPAPTPFTPPADNQQQPPAQQPPQAA